MSFRKKYLHNDVLECPIPETKEERESLLTEIKDRGNLAFKIKNYEEADYLYQRGIDICPDNHIFLSNRVNSLLHLDKPKEAVIFANRLLELKPDWSKGYFRKAQCLEKLKKYDEAIQFYDIILEKEDNKNIKTRRIICHQNQLKFPNKKEVKKEKTKQPEIPKSNKGTPKLPPLKYQGNLSLKGYRTKLDGAKTTYFNHEQTELEKKMIGDITPKPVTDRFVKINNSNLGSAWSNGSTFEERDMLYWSKKYLESQLKGIDYQELEVKGYANITIVNTRISHLYDLNIKVVFEDDTNIEFRLQDDKPDIRLIKNKTIELELKDKIQEILKEFIVIFKLKR